MSDADVKSREWPWLKCGMRAGVKQYVGNTLAIQAVEKNRFGADVSSIGTLAGAGFAKCTQPRVAVLPDFLRNL